MRLIQLFLMLLLSLTLTAGDPNVKRVFVLDHAQGDTQTSIMIKRTIEDGVEEIDLTVDGSNITFFPDDIAEGETHTYTLENGQDLVLRRDQDGLAFDYDGETHRLDVAAGHEGDGHVFITLGPDGGVIHQAVMDMDLDVRLDHEFHQAHSWSSDEDGDVKVQVISGGPGMHWVSDEDGEVEFKFVQGTPRVDLEWISDGDLNLDELDETIRRKVEEALAHAKAEGGSGYRMKFKQAVKVEKKSETSQTVQEDQ